MFALRRARKGGPAGRDRRNSPLTRPSDTVSPFWKGERVRSKGVADFASRLSSCRSHPKSPALGLAPANGWRGRGEFFDQDGLSGGRDLDFFFLEPRENPVSQIALGGVLG